MVLNLENVPVSQSPTFLMLRSSLLSSKADKKANLSNLDLRPINVICVEVCPYKNNSLKPFGPREHKIHLLILFASPIH